MEPIKIGITVDPRPALRTAKATFNKIEQMEAVHNMRQRQADERHQLAKKELARKTANEINKIDQNNLSKRLLLRKNYLRKVEQMNRRHAQKMKHSAERDSLSLERQKLRNSSKRRPDLFGSFAGHELLGGGTLGKGFAAGNLASSLGLGAGAAAGAAVGVVALGVAAQTTSTVLQEAANLYLNGARQFTGAITELGGARNFQEMLVSGGRSEHSLFEAFRNVGDNFQIDPSVLQSQILGNVDYFSTEQLSQSLSQFTDITGTIKPFLDNLKSLTDYAQVSDTDLNDLTKLVANVETVFAGVIGPDGIESYLNNLLAQARSEIGKVPLSQSATEMTAIQAQAIGFGGDTLTNLKTLGALFQASARVAPSSSEAATYSLRASQQIQRAALSDPEYFKSRGIEISEQGKIQNLPEALAQIAADFYTNRAALPKKITGEERASRGISGITAVAQDIAGQQGISPDELVKDRELLVSIIRDEIIQKQANLTVSQARMNADKEALSTQEKLTKEFNRLEAEVLKLFGTALESSVPFVNMFVDSLIEQLPLLKETFYVATQAAVELGLALVPVGKAAISLTTTVLSASSTILNNLSMFTRAIGSLLMLIPGMQLAAAGVLVAGEALDDEAKKFGSAIDKSVYALENMQVVADGVENTLIKFKDGLANATPKGNADKQIALNMLGDKNARSKFESEYNISLDKASIGQINEFVNSQLMQRKNENISAYTAEYGQAPDFSTAEGKQRYVDFAVNKQVRELPVTAVAAYQARFGTVGTDEQVLAFNELQQEKALQDKANKELLDKKATEVVANKLQTFNKPHSNFFGDENVGKAISMKKSVQTELDKGINVQENQAILELLNKIINKEISAPTEETVKKTKEQEAVDQRAQEIRDREMSVAEQIAKTNSDAAETQKNAAKSMNDGVTAFEKAVKVLGDKVLNYRPGGYYDTGGLPSGRSPGQSINDRN